MWNKTSEEQSAPKSAAPRPAVATSTPVQSAPNLAAQPGRGGTTMGPSMSVKGEVYSREELYVDGEIQGSIELQHRLTVGPNGKIRATIKAREVVLHGSIQGNVQAVEKIIIREKGSLVGDIKTPGIFIEDGPHFKGSIVITTVTPIKNAP